MTDTHVTLTRPRAVMGAIVLLLVGAAVTLLLLRATDGGRRDTEPPRASGTAPPAAGHTGPASDEPLPDIEVRLSENAITRAGIVVKPAAASATMATIRIPGIIEADAYRRVTVTPLVAGRITRVNAELGEQVKRGAPMAVIYSPDLSAAQTKYLSARAELAVHTQELRRTERLVEIGAASQQEVERIRASHTAVGNAVQEARAQLLLLGMSAGAIGKLDAVSSVSAATTVPAPIDGVVTERQANVGLNVDPSTALFTVVDLAQVWVIGDLYEKDFARVRVGSETTVTTTAYPGVALRGRVAYIDPQLNEQTRTARVRVEVPNPRRELRLGMYADVQIAAAAGGRAVSVPREAVQTIGNRHFIYVSKGDAPGRFIERHVQLGAATGETIEIASGLTAGELIVVKGSFFVRAERERLGLRPLAGQGSTPQPPAAAPPSSAHAREARVTITEKGFEPDRIIVSGGGPVRLTLLRTSDKSCATEVVFPSLDIRRQLPLNQPVLIEFIPKQSGEIAFACGMDMLRGTVVVR